MTSLDGARLPETPSGREAQPATVESSLAQYLQAQGTTPPAVKSRRGELVKALRANLQCPEAWWGFLKHEEGMVAQNTGSLTGPQRGSRHSVSLFHLFSLATQTIPRQGNYESHAYLHIWLGYARQQWHRSEDEARDTFKMLKSQLIGDSFAYLYSEWAMLEDLAGNRSRALGILKKGLASGAQPSSVLESTKAALEGKAAQKYATHTHSTVNSNVSAATGFLTPASGTCHHQALPRSPTLDITMDMKTGGVGSTVTQLAASASRGRSYARGADPDNPTLTMNKASMTAHTSGTAVTRHSASSEDATYTLHTRGASPATGHTMASSSSHGSGDENAETVVLKQGSQRASPAPSGEEPTCVVNHGLQHRKVPHRPLQSSLRGPRRIGLGGGASRVLSGERTATQTLTGNPAAEPGRSPQSSGEKRKADSALKHVPSTNAAPGGDGVKRRLSPEPELRRTLSQGTAWQQAEQPADPPPPAKPAVALQRPQVQESEETVAIQHSGLARKARDSMAPKAFLESERLASQRGGRVGDASGGSGPAMAFPKPSTSTSRPAPQRAQPEASKEDPEATALLPAKPTATKPSTPASMPAAAATPNTASARSRPVPPLPPSYATSRSSAPLPPTPQPASTAPQSSARGEAAQGSGSTRPEKENGGPQLRGDAQQGGQAMGPPPARSRQPLANIGEQRPHAQPPSGREGRKEGQARQYRCREDENMVMVRNTRYTKLECVGRGGSSKVFKVMAPNRKIHALKRIKLQGRDREAATGFIDEIALLQRLRGHSNIIQLIDAEVVQSEGLIYMVLEYGDIDLARLLAKHEKARREDGAEDLDENFIRLYWQQMLQAVHTIHEARIVHSDLKPANFLMVEGTLKLIDFGIAKAIQSDTTSIARESQVGTLNYMSPEAILGGANNIRGGPPMKVGRASDIWSLGCILYQMVHGHTPFSALAFIQKMHAITDPKHQIAFPPVKNAALQDSLKRCLDRNPRTRIVMQELLEHPFLRPSAAPAPGLVGVTRSQLKKLLAQLSAVGTGNNRADIDAMSEVLFRQLSNGEAVDLAALVAQQQPGKAAAATQRSMIPPQAGGAVASRAARPASQQARPAAAGAATGIMQHDIKAGRAALKKVEVPVSKPQPESSLEAKLREGIAKFRFDDTAGSSAPGEDGTTHNFSP